MENYKGKDFLGNSIKNGDFAVLARYSTLYPVIVISCNEGDSYARFVYVSDYNKTNAENGKRCNGGAIVTKNFIKTSSDSLSKEIKEQFDIIKRRIKTIE